jgi:hypothetical protein
MGGYPGRKHLSTPALVAGVWRSLDTLLCKIVHGSPTPGFPQGYRRTPRVPRRLYAHSLPAADLGLGTMISEYASIRDSNDERSPCLPMRLSGHRGGPIVVGSEVWIGRVPLSLAAAPSPTAQTWGRMRSSLETSQQVATVADVLAVDSL